MRPIATTVISLRALRRNPLRSTLTALGIIIGVAAVIAMVSIGNGAKSQVEAQIATLGQNVILIFSGSANTGGMRGGWGSAATLTLEDAAAIEREIPEVIAVSPEVRNFRQVAAGNQNWFTQVLGVSTAYLQIRGWPLAEGENFTEQDERSNGKVAVIGRTVAQQLFGASDPIGQTIRVNNVPFQVLGVLQPKGLSVMGSDQDDIVLVPYTTAMRQLTRQTNLRSMSVQVYDARVMDAAQEKIIDLLRQLHRIGPGREDDFTVRSQQDIAEAATATSRTMTILLGAIAGVSLVVGGIGIMNIMLVSVTERTREIGIRLAVGAHGRDIMLQFLTEAMILSLLGGALGVTLGVGTSEILSRVNNWPTLVSTTAIVVAVVFSAAIGIFFGFYPARKAASLDPIEALRYE